MSNQGFTPAIGPRAASTSGAQEWNAGTVNALGSGLSLSGTTLSAEASQLLRTIAFPFVGTLPSGQTYTVAMTQAGTLLANGGSLASYIPTNPTATQSLIVRTIHGGAVTTQGTISVSTSGVVTPPTFGAVAIAAGDSVQIENQPTADATFANASISLQFQVT